MYQRKILTIFKTLLQKNEPFVIAYRPVGSSVGHAVVVIGLHSDKRYVRVIDSNIKNGEGKRSVSYISKSLPLRIVYFRQI